MSLVFVTVAQMAQEVPPVLLQCMMVTAARLADQHSEQVNKIDRDFRLMKNMWPIECMLIMIIHVMDGVPTATPWQLQEFAASSGFSCAHRLIAHVNAVGRCEEDLLINMDEFTARMNAASVTPQLWKDHRLQLYRDVQQLTRNFGLFAHGHADLRDAWTCRSQTWASLRQAHQTMHRLRACSRVHRAQVDELRLDPTIFSQDRQHWTDSLYVDFRQEILSQSRTMHQAVVSQLKKQVAIVKQQG